MEGRELSADWLKTLKLFNERNVGRRTRLEIDDPEIGAQWAEVDFPLHGVTYDPRDQRIEIMVGEHGAVSDHLTHSIQNPTAVDVVTAPTGADRALRIEHSGGQTLLWLG